MKAKQGIRISSDISVDRSSANIVFDSRNYTYSILNGYGGLVYSSLVTTGETGYSYAQIMPYLIVPHNLGYAPLTRYTALTLINQEIVIVNYGSRPTDLTEMCLVDKNNFYIGVEGEVNYGGVIKLWISPTTLDLESPADETVYIL